MGALSRRKGAEYERWITRALRCVFGNQVKRGIGQERAGGEIADVTGVPHFWVQTKHGAYVSIREALLQAEMEMAVNHKMQTEAAASFMARPPDDRWPLAVVRLNGERDTATMRLEHFLPLIAEWYWSHQILHEPGAEPFVRVLRVRIEVKMKEFAAALEE